MNQDFWPAVLSLRLRPLLRLEHVGEVEAMLVGWLVEEAVLVPVAPAADEPEVPEPVVGERIVVMLQMPILDTPPAA